MRSDDSEYLPLHFEPGHISTRGKWILEHGRVIYLSDECTASRCEDMLDAWGAVVLVNINRVVFVA